MGKKSNYVQLQRQYQGYLNTPFLWKNNAVFELEQFELSKTDNRLFDQELPENIVLGKRVERFVFEEFRQKKNIELLLENVQIQNEKITVGEIDCILKQDAIPVHIEIIYKFYLYDPDIGKAELDCWIGPNRKDTLLLKLKKLKEKQLPLVNSVYAEPILNRIDVEAKNIKQRVFFKAQLFAPYKADKVHFNLLNADCLQGFYVGMSNLGQFSAATFHIPAKMDWLIEPQAQVVWLPYRSFLQIIRPRIDNKQAVLCWIKFANNQLQKFFVVWWER